MYLCVRSFDFAFFYDIAIGLGIRVRFMVFNAFQQYFKYIVAVSFIGGENRSSWRKPPINASQ